MNLSTTDLINLAWVGLCAMLVFFMQAGFALVECGSARSKNAINVIMKNYTDMCVGAFAYWLVGYGLMFGASAAGWLGTSDFALNTMNASTSMSWFYQVMFASTAATIVSGAMAERMHFNAYLVSSTVMTLLIYPVYGHWAWNPNGWLKQLGFIDFAGSSVVHSIGAWCALAGVMVLGPRLGRFSKTGEANDIPGHNLPMVALGGFVLWLGWFGFNGGSVGGFDKDNVGLVLVNTHLGGVAGVVGAIGWAMLTRRPVLMSTTVNASLAGLVAVTAGAATLSPLTASLVGLIAGVLFIYTAEFIRSRRIDDAVDAFAVHGVGGIWGTLAAGLFYSGDFFNVSRLGVQLLGIGAAFLWAFPVSYATFKLIDKLMGLRASTMHEQRGLDYTEHNELGYPEFQNSPAQLKMGE
jgi:ammonium transporter, Amt family